MRSYETPKGPVQILASVLFFVGLALTLIVHSAPAIGIALMVIGVLLSISMLFVQSRKEH